MIAHQIRDPQTRTVLVTQIDGETEEQILDIALRTTRVTRESIASSIVSRDQNDSTRAVVTLRLEN